MRSERNSGENGGPEPSEAELDRDEPGDDALPVGLSEDDALRRGRLAGCKAHPSE